MTRVRTVRCVFSIVVLAALWLVAAPAHAQVCQNDNDPRAAGSGTPIIPDDVPACPNPTQRDNATHFAGGDIIYTPRQVTGACHPELPNTYTNGCLGLNESCEAGQCVVQYEALMYRPTTAARGKPAVLLVPGSTNCTTIGGTCVYQPENFCGIKNVLLKKGYVVMEVLPRGYGTNASHHSTGFYINDAVQQQQRLNAACTAAPGNCASNNLLAEGMTDVAAGYDLLASQGFVNAAQIGVLGHSLGGTRALAFNRVDHGQKALIAIAPGSESWCFGNGTGNTILWDETINSVDLARAPIYTFQPLNDVNLESGSVIAHEAAENRQEYQAAYFPKVSQGGADLTFGDEAHRCFVKNKRNVKQWAPTVINFLHRYGVGGK